VRGGSEGRNAVATARCGFGRGREICPTLEQVTRGGKPARPNPRPPSLGGKGGEKPPPPWGGGVGGGVFEGRGGQVRVPLTRRKRRRRWRTPGSRRSSPTCRWRH